MSANNSSDPDTFFLDPYFVSHYRVVLGIFTVLSNIFTITALVALLRQKFHLRRVIFLTILLPNILITYTFLFLQPVMLLPNPVVHLLGPLQFHSLGYSQLVILSVLFTAALAVFAYSLLYIYFTAIARISTWNHFTGFFLTGLAVAFSTVNILLIFNSTEKITPISLSMTFPKWTVNYIFIEYLVLLMMGCAVVTFTIERAVTSMNEFQLVKQRTADLQWSLLKLLVCYGAIFLFIFALPSFLLLSSLHFKWRLSTGRPIFYLSLLAPSAVVCPAVFISHFLHVKQFRLAVTRPRQNTISPVAK